MYKSIKQIAAQMLLESHEIIMESRGPGTVHMVNGNAITYDILEIDRDKGIVYIGKEPNKQTTIERFKKVGGYIKFPSLAVLGPFTMSKLYQEHGRERAKAMLREANNILNRHWRNQLNFNEVETSAIRNLNMQMQAIIRQHMARIKSENDSAKSATDDYDLDDRGDDFGHMQDAAMQAANQDPEYIKLQRQILDLRNVATQRNSGNVNATREEEIHKAAAIMAASRNAGYPLTRNYRMIWSMNPANIARIE